MSVKFRPELCHESWVGLNGGADRANHCQGSLHGDSILQMFIVISIFSWSLRLYLCHEKSNNDGGWTGATVVAVNQYSSLGLALFEDCIIIVKMVVASLLEAKTWEMKARRLGKCESRFSPGMSVTWPINQSVNQSINQSISNSINQSANQSLS